MSQNLTDLVSAENDRDSLRHARARHAIDRAKIDREDFAIQEEKRAQRLILCRPAHVLIHGEPRQERADIGRAKLLRMLFVMEHDVPSNPVRVRFLGSTAIVPRANSVPDAVD